MGLGDYVSLLEHLPRIGALLNKLLPLVESRFGQNANAANDELRATVDALRAEMGKGSAADESLYRQLEEQRGALAATLEETRGTRSAVETTERKLHGVEQQIAKLHTLVTICMAMLALTLVGLGIVIFRH